MPRQLHRIAIIIPVCLLVWLLISTLEVKKTAYSCRTLLSCIGLGSHRRYQYSSATANPTESELVLRDETARFSRTTEGAAPDLLILVLARDARSWSQDFRSTQRTAYDFVDLLASTRLNLSTVSLAMATTDPALYTSMRTATLRLPLAKTSLYLQKEPEITAPYRLRHDPSLQLARRAGLAKLRNRLMHYALEDEQHLLWLDADVVELSPNLVQTLIAQSLSNERAGIITAMCHQNEMENYDKNAWRLNSPSLMGAIPGEQREESVRRLVAEQLFLPAVMDDVDEGGLIQIDSVGGTVLYMRAELVRQGLVFPYFNAVGTEWGRPGWIGVETEGLCYMARELEGGGCFALGRGHWARHTDWG
ncbi:hypothetical protein LTR62_003537 [Meristemomyces frigidus]|uniref:Glycosyltransferase family 62 protein n=1 Tax=Meristemomyces frigidus TaxID=1508187 RepID=A0AAN7TJY2_9PEZI|nr:hypothetical protein LTR62_003537 [Meristemomyces frigidus]